MGFLEDVRKGREHGEVVIREYLEGKGLEIKHVKEHHDIEIEGFNKEKISEDEFKKFISNYGRRIEVKRDFTADRTGNFYVEVWSTFKEEKNTPGAITTTDADTIVIVLKDRYIFLNKASFISWIIDEAFRDTDTAKAWKSITSKTKTKISLMPAGSNPYVRGILIPLSDIETKFKGVIDIVRI